MFCTKCWQQNADSAKFYTSCGNTLPQHHTDVVQASKQTAENLWKNLPGFIANRLHYLVIPALLIILLLFLPLRLEEYSLTGLQSIQAFLWTELKPYDLEEAGRGVSPFVMVTIVFLLLLASFYFLHKFFPKKKHAIDVCAIVTAVCVFVLVSSIQSLGVDSLKTAMQYAGGYFSYSFFQIATWFLVLYIGLSLYNLVKEFHIFKK